MTFEGLAPAEAKEFAARWLPAWTGNDPARLTSFYSDDVFYSDPAVPQGVHGRSSLLAYFQKLLARNPNWVWTNNDAIPMHDGFVNLWHAVIPLADRTVEIDGLCTVQLRGGLIYRNMVFFDRSRMLRSEPTDAGPR